MMRRKILRLLKNWRIIVLIIFLLISYAAINYNFSAQEEVVINGIKLGSPASNAGMTYDPEVPLTDLERITYIEEYPIHSLDDYYKALREVSAGSKKIVIRTDKNKEGYVISLEGINRSIEKVIGISVREAPKSNIHLGIELEGGTRMILEPVTNVSEETFNMIIENLRNRLDVYGASGTKVTAIKDTFTGKKYILIESPSSNKEEVYDLISKQGKFEAKLGNVTVFTGKDVLRVFHDPKHSGLEGCSQTHDGFYICSYRFQVEISSEASERFLEAAKKIPIVSAPNGESYLRDKITFCLDGHNITSLNVASVFKYQKITTPTITVSGNPAITQEKAMMSAKKEMNMLQALLSTEILPTKLRVVESYDISSSLGKKLLHNSLIVGLLAIVAVATTVAIRYRNWIVFIGIMITLLSELFIILGMSAFLRITIDLAAIGGLIAAIGTGVDDQIIIVDEFLRKDNKGLNKKRKIKKALFIILVSYTTTVAAMFPLLVAGLKMLQGFAFTIILGVTIGILITRPAFGAMIETLLENK